MDLTLELSSACNLKCVMCPTGNGELTRKKSLMSWDLFEHIIRSNKNLGRINCNNWGESFMHPRLVDMIRLMREVHPESYIAIATNGT